jgi:hypothetical protein
MRGRREMKVNLRDQLKAGKTIKVKHPVYAFTIHALVKMEDGKDMPTIKLSKINLPQKANKAEKYLLKLAQIYCFDVMCNNLLDDVLNSLEYKKVIYGLRNTNDNAAVNS